jgi:hypothetical protein
MQQQPFYSPFPLDRPPVIQEVTNPFTTPASPSIPNTNIFIPPFPIPSTTVQSSMSSSNGSTKPIRLIEDEEKNEIDPNDEFVKTQLEYMRFYEEKRKREMNDEHMANYYKTQEILKPPQKKNTEEEDYMLALKLMQEEEDLQREKDKKAKLLAEDEALARLIMEEEQASSKRRQTQISDAEYAARLYAEETKQHNSVVVSDAQIAKLMHEKQELEQRLRDAEQMPRETIIDVASVDYPTYWQPQATPFQSFDVAKGSDEWKRVEGRFRESLPQENISRIERVQNKNLWLWFYLKKNELEAKNAGSKGANEKFVFHGSRANAYEIILKEGFDVRVANMSGAYGAGIYFAHASATSSGYVAASGGHRKMLFCRVLVGDIGPGAAGLRRPPEKKSFFGGKTILYDSVGNEGNVYVVFDNYQCYPEYVLHY